MNHEVREILETPFSLEKIKQRKGFFGRNLDYIEGHSVIGRLNEAFQSDWSFTLTEYRIMDEEVIVVGRLKANDVVKEQFGSSNITRDSQSRKALCVGDDLKGAATDALKKCASLLGVGLHLYGENSSNRDHSNTGFKSHHSNNGNDKNNYSWNADNGNGNYSENGSNGNGNNIQLITPKQMKYAFSLARRNNIQDNDVQTLAFEMFGKELHQISKHEASSLIQQLAA